jgi:hypothetical protein
VIKRAVEVLVFWSGPIGERIGSLAQYYSPTKQQEKAFNRRIKRAVEVFVFWSGPIGERIGSLA